MQKPKRIGPFVILREIGKGGMATVYEAQLPSGYEHVALKVACGPLSDFLKEEAENLANLAMSLNHPNILKILPLPFSDGEKQYYVARDPETDCWYIALEYADGGSLRDLLGSRRRLEVSEAIAIIRQVGSALDYAHSKGIIHRDIKPTNILFKQLPSGDTKALLADFGLSTARAWELGEGGGTPRYMSPEQAAERIVDHRSDIYSLGVVLYEMLTGKVPFEGTSSDVIHQHIYKLPTPPSAINPQIPQKVEAVVLKALAKDPEDRSQSAKEMVLALEEAIETVEWKKAEPVW